MRDLGEGRSTVVVPLPGSDEVHDLSLSFAAMSQRLIERETERNVLEREVIDSTERERQRIGHELHDGVGQQLTAALMATNGLLETLQSAAPECGEKAANIVAQLRDAITEVRSLSHGLAPVPLWEGGLEHALQSLTESTRLASSVRCVFECNDPVSVESSELAANLYRIAQEAVNNALKHASPSEIRIGLGLCDNILRLEIEDDGEGLPDTPWHATGIGFRIMRHRAEVMKGTFEAGSAPAGGTLVTVKIPFVPRKP